MKSFTNYAAGARGINLKDGTTRWVEPGQTAEIDPKDIAGDVPDMGKPRAVSDGDDDLRGQLDAANAEIARLNDQLAAFDKDGDGKPGGSKPKA